MVKLLLHVCCAPCATYVVDKLKPASAYFYNPNVQPEEEYLLRLSEFRRYASVVGLDFIEGAYDTADWFSAVDGYEGEREGGRRCELCYRKRLEKTAAVAKEKGYTHIATTLTVGPNKDAGIINEIGKKAAGVYGVEFCSGDFKKQDGFKISCRLSKEFGLYRQDYCGCIYSRTRDSGPQE